MFSDGFTNFLTKSNVTYDNIEEDKKKTQKFLLDIGYDIGKGDKRSSRYKMIKLILRGREKIFVRGLTKNKLGNHSGNASNNLTERLELIILETKPGHDGLYDEMLNISKQLLQWILLMKNNKTILFLIMVNELSYDYVCDLAYNHVNE